jgi:hypothetical protein
MQQMFVSLMKDEAIELRNENIKRLSAMSLNLNSEACSGASTRKRFRWHRRAGFGQ